MTGWRLQGCGRIPWPELREKLAGYTCLWVDRYQHRVGEPPAEPPITTHLWGWTDGRYARVRVDGDAGYLGVLRAPDAADAAEGDPVAVIRRPALMRPEAGELSVELLEVPGPGPVTFLRPALGGEGS